MTSRLTSRPAASRRTPVSCALVAALLTGAGAGCGRPARQVSPAPTAPTATAPTAASPATAAGAAFDRGTILATVRRVADRQLLRNATRGVPDPGWARAALYPGILAAHDVTGDRRYLDEAVRWAAEEGRWTIPGGPSTQPAKGRRFADNQAIGWTYAELSRRLGDPSRRADVERAFDETARAEAPGRVEWWWADALYMAPPTLARMAGVTGDPKYLHLMDRLFWDAVDFLYDREERLMFRDRDFFGARVGGRKLFWARGNGWVLGGLARVIRDLPAEHPTRGRYVALFREMSDRLATLQQPDGLWRANLLVPSHHPNPETSGTAFFVFAMAAGVNDGLLERARFEPVVRRGWLGLNNCLLPDGTLGYVQPIGGDPRPATPTDTQEYAAGAFLLAAREVLAMGPPTPGTDVPPAPLPPYVAPAPATQPGGGA